MSSLFSKDLIPVPAVGEVTIGRKASCDAVIGSPLISNVHCVVYSASVIQVSVLDRSRNGTWVRKRNNDSSNKSASAKAARVSKDFPCHLDAGDVIYLLAPKHADSSNFRLQLRNTEGDGSYLFHLKSGDKDSLEQDAEEVAHKRTLENPDFPRNKISRISSGKEDYIQGISSRLDHSCDSVVTSSSSKARGTLSSDNGTWELNSHTGSVSMRSDEMILEDTTVKVSADSSKEAFLADKDNSETKVEEKGVGIFSSSLSVEQCPKCLELFPVIDLIAHFSECIGIPSWRSSSSPEESMVDRRSVQDDELGECPSCARAFPIEELVVHCQHCCWKGSTSSSPILSAYIPTSRHIDSDLDGPGAEISRLHNDGKGSIPTQRDEAEEDIVVVDESSTDGETSSGTGPSLLENTGPALLEGTGPAIVVSAGLSDDASVKVARESVTGRDNMQELELCENCLKEFPLYELLAHHTTCTVKSKVRRLRSHGDGFRNLFLQVGVVCCIKFQSHVLNKLFRRWFL